jgi:hypothetical protein
MEDRLAAVVSTIFDFLAARIQFGVFSFRALILVPWKAGCELC